MQQHQSSDLAECEREGPFLSTSLSRPFEDRAGAWSIGTPFSLNDLEALMNFALAAKEWITAHALKL